MKQDTLVVRLPNAMKARVKAVCEEKGYTMSGIVVEALAAFLDADAGAPHADPIWTRADGVYADWTAKKKEQDAGHQNEKVFERHYTMCRLEDISRTYGRIQDYLGQMRLGLNKLIAETQENPEDWNHFDIETANYDTERVCKAVEDYLENVRHNMRKMEKFAKEHGYM